MNLPKELRTSTKHVNEDGTPRTDILIFKDYLLCHPDFREQARKGFREMLGITLEDPNEDEDKKSTKEENIRSLS